MVCIAGKPNDDLFDVRCYRDTFIPVVFRAFQLGYGVAAEKVGAEIQAGKLALSREPTAGYRCLGPAAATTRPTIRSTRVTSLSASDPSPTRFVLRFDPCSDTDQHR